MTSSSKKWLIIGIAAAIPGLLLLQSLRFYRIPNESMEDTLLVGDHIAVFSLGLSKRNRGDLVTFPAPIVPTQLFIKRIIAISGDHLRIDDKQVYVNGVVVEEPYAVYKWDRSPDERNFPTVMTDPSFPGGIEMLKNNVVNGEVVVPPNSYFVLGDNRDNTTDSRYWGFIPAESVIGFPLFIYWSSEEDAGIRWNRIFKTIH